MIWEKENWVPGVLSKRQLKKLVEDGFLLDTKDNPDDYDHSSRDLHLTAEGYEMKGSIKPCGKEYKDFYLNSDLATKLAPNQDNEFELKRLTTYVFRIRETFSPSAKGSNIYAQATAKSTIGRLDVVARLIVDGMHVYEYMDPNDINTGNMFLEITPITFKIKVKEDVSLSQIRFFLGKPSESVIPNQSISKIALKGSRHQDGTLSIDLSEERINGQPTAAFQAVRTNGDDFVSIWEKEKLEPKNYWKCMPSTPLQGINRFTIHQDEFYILRSKERIALPKGVAVYCQAMDETLGEMRIHYAGFAHPYFGLNRQDFKVGTPLIFEVRGHNVEVNLTDGEKLAKLIFYRMSEDCEEEKNTNPDPYNNQELLLSKVFKPWDRSFLDADLTTTKTTPEKS